MVSGALAQQPAGPTPAGEMTLHQALGRLAAIHGDASYIIAGDDSDAIAVSFAGRSAPQDIRGVAESFGVEATCVDDLWVVDGVATGPLESAPWAIAVQEDPAWSEPADTEEEAILRASFSSVGAPKLRRALVRVAEAEGVPRTPSLERGAARVGVRLRPGTPEHTAVYEGLRQHRLWAIAASATPAATDALLERALPDVGPRWALQVEQQAAPAGTRLTASLRPPDDSGMEWRVAGWYETISEPGRFYPPLGTTEAHQWRGHQRERALSPLGTEPVFCTAAGSLREVCAELSSVLPVTVTAHESLAAVPVQLRLAGVPLDVALPCLAAAVGSGMASTAASQEYVVGGNREANWPLFGLLPLEARLAYHTRDDLRTINPIRGLVPERDYERLLRDGVPWGELDAGLRQRVLRLAARPVRWAGEAALAEQAAQPLFIVFILDQDTGLLWATLSPDSLKLLRLPVLSDEQAAAVARGDLTLRWPADPLLSHPRASHPYAPRNVGTRSSPPVVTGTGSAGGSPVLAAGP
ncbi:MAG: hypothetical protein GF320_11590 [Armatimonadia bacterium]|nr:hypothetical protein [Armatimonadia bacterium]